MGSIGPTFDVFSDYKNTINGKLTSTKETRFGINPATGKPNPEVPVSTKEDVDEAMAAGKAAFKKWAKVPWEDRKKAVLAYADAVEKYTDDFAKLLTQEQGKPVSVDRIFIAQVHIADMNSCNSLPVKSSLPSNGSETCAT
jgi:acyl-CoA reductase-like NAD-dependent aldehyde dehydrogenase